MDNMGALDSTDKNVASQLYISKGKNILTPTTQGTAVNIRMIEAPPPIMVKEQKPVTSLEKTAECTEKEGDLSDRDLLRHTASLWKYKPIPQDEPEPYEEVKTECTTIGKYHITAARVRGKKHKHEGTNCDDWFETRSIGDFIVIAVADGAGSKKFSRIGAKSSCLGAMQFLEQALKNNNIHEQEMQSALIQDVHGACFQQMAAQLAEIAQDAVMAARNSVVDAFQKRRANAYYSEVVKRELQLNDFSATFLLTIALPLRQTEELLIITCQVGDGITAALNTQAPYNQIVTLLGNADSGAFAGETEFLTSSTINSRESLMNRTKIARKQFDVIMSMTDGVADDYDPNSKEMLRLYTDLCVNRIIDFPNLKNIYGSILPTEISNLRKVIPQAQSYPNPNEKKTEKMAPIQYTKEFCELNEINLQDMWEKYQDHLAVMTEDMNLAQGKNAAVRLKDWLDNYVVRGSFDDRTLVILQHLQQGGN